MLMFDNSIFASFIPQILMVLGFFSAIIAPHFTSEHAKSNKITEIKTEDDKMLQQPHNIDKTIHFSNYFNNLQEITIENAETQSFPAPSKITSYFITDDKFIPRAFEQNLFSRPPPFFA